MTLADSLRLLVVARAGGAWEYCRLLEAASGVTFHLEHVRPRVRGGRSVLSNLALSCPRCNLAKADRTHGYDRSANRQPLFSPRDFEPSALGWHLHFVLERPSGIIVPRTLVAEATIDTLRFNDPNRLFARRLLIQVGLIA